MADPLDDETLREAARARGFRLVKSRRRKPGGDFGRYGLVGLESGRECLGFSPDGLAATAEEVHAYLRGVEVAAWKRSLIGVVADPPGRSDASTTTSRSATARRGAKAGAPPATLPPAAPGPHWKPSQSDSPPRLKGEAGRGPSSPPPPQISIRDAIRRDAAALARLLDRPAATLAERLAAAIRSDEPPLIAERDGVIGVAAWTIIPTLQDGPRACLTLLLVAEADRRQGIGTRLLETAEQRLREVGITTIDFAVAMDFEAPAAGFLRRAGYARTTNGFGKRL